MDIVELVCSRSEEIVGFIACNDARKCDKSHIACQISDLAGQIEAIAAPLTKLDEINQLVDKCLRDLNSVLEVILHNLQRWNESHSHSRSTTRLLHLHLPGGHGYAQLKDNKEFLLGHYTTLTRAVQIVMRPKGYNIISPPEDIRSLLEQRSVQKTRAANDASVSFFFEAEEFWKLSVGDETEFANTEEFSGLLSSWLDEDLGEIERKRLILRLDEKHTGYISFQTFQNFVRNGRLRETVHLYASDPRLPLLLLVDSDVTHTADHMLRAIGHNVTVVQFSSTHAVKTWISLHIDFLKANCDPKHVCVMTNQILYERDLNTHLRYHNEQGGEQITSYIRETGLFCPILVIATPENIDSTKYVKKYEQAGSTVAKYYIYKSFLASLGAGPEGKSDTRWMKYDA